MRLLIYMLSALTLIGCEKKIKLNYGTTPIKQVILSDFSPDNYLRVNISKSKQPNDFSPVEFLADCKVDLYEDSIFLETLPFVLKDTLSGLGYYTSTVKLSPNKTYKIISNHPTLGIAEASEYLPPYPKMLAILTQHADSINTSTTGKYGIIIQDSANCPNYYYVSVYYKILKPVLDSSGNTIYKTDYIRGIPSYSLEVPNPANYPLSFFTDPTFDGQTKSISFDFHSQYNNLYQEITLIIEVSNLGKNFYNWYTQQIRYKLDYLNQGQMERSNISSNIVNGYGHFTAFSSAYIPIVIK